MITAAEATSSEGTPVAVPSHRQPLALAGSFTAFMTSNSTF